VAGLVALWPSYVAFLLSFAVILIMWESPRAAAHVGGVTYPFLFANGLLLLTVTFVPFRPRPRGVPGTAEARTRWRSIARHSW